MAGPPDTPPGIPHREFLEQALASAGEWTRYADPKALGVLVLLGLGVNDLIDHSSRFLHPREAATDTCGLINVTGHSCQGISATVLFVLACVAAVAVTVLVTKALFSRTTLQGLLGLQKDEHLPQSRFFFGEVRRYGSQEAYAQALLAQKEHELLRDIAGQVYEVSSIAYKKHEATQRAYALALIFLGLWAAARILLSIVE